MNITDCCNSHKNATSSRLFPNVLSIYCLDQTCQFMPIPDIPEGIGCTARRRCNEQPSAPDYFNLQSVLDLRSPEEYLCAFFPLNASIVGENWRILSRTCWGSDN